MHKKKRDRRKPRPTVGFTIKKKQKNIKESMRREKRKGLLVLDTLRNIKRKERTEGNL